MSSGAPGRVVLVWRRFGLGGGGIATYVAALAHLLVQDRPVTVVTEAGQALAGILPGSAEVLTVVPPPADEAEVFNTEQHAYSARVFAVLRARFADDPPALIEFQDFGAEGVVTLQARHAGHPMLRSTPCVLRLNTTAEMTALLNGALPRTPDAQWLFALERLSLQVADALLYADPGIHASYQSYYGRGALAPGVQLRQPLSVAATRDPWDESDLLHLVCVGRLERRKGLHALIDAFRILPRDDVRLTFLGGDTDTGPLATSMSDALHLAVGSDERISFAGPQSQETVTAILRQAHVGVMTSAWECWPAAGLETLAANRPLLATPVGGLGGMASDPRSGVLVERADSARAIAAAIDQLCDDRESLREAVAAGAPADRYEALIDLDGVRRWYRDTTEPTPHRGRAPRPAAVPAPPLVTVVVPYHRAHRWVEQTLQSIADQSYTSLDVVIVNDGTFETDDRAIARLALDYGARLISKPNGGVGSARNFGVAVARGTYVAFLDADNLFHPDFIARGVELLEADPELAYFTSWLRSIDYRGVPLGDIHGYRPLGGQLDLLDERNVAGDAACLVRYSAFAEGVAYSELLVSYEDHDFYRRLRDAGVPGAVYPEALVAYRVVAGSNSRTFGLRHQQRMREELRAARAARRLGVSQ